MRLAGCLMAGREQKNVARRDFQLSPSISPDYVLTICRVAMPPLEGWPSFIRALVPVTIAVPPGCGGRRAETLSGSTELLEATPAGRRRSSLYVCE